MHSSLSPGDAQTKIAANEARITRCVAPNPAARRAVWTEMPLVGHLAHLCRPSLLDVIR